VTKQLIKPYILHLSIFLLLSLLSIVIYSNTLHSPFLFDDVCNITENSHIRLTEINIQSLKDAAFSRPSWARPIPNISFALNYYIGGYHVAGYHMVNIVIHIINGILVYLLAIFTFRQLGVSPFKGKVMSLFASLIFIAHPINIQSVTYLVQRMNSMAALFYLLSLILYIKARLSRVRWRRWTLFLCVALSAILAMGSKQLAATLPFTIIVYECYFFQDLTGCLRKKNIAYVMLPLIVLVALILIYLGENPIERILAGYSRRDFTLVERLLTQPRVIIFYISLILLPLPSRMNLIHHIDTSHSLIEPVTTLISLLIIAALIYLSIYWAKKRRLISFAIAWFFINLAIESSFIGLEMIFEHRLYLPMVAISLVVPYILFTYRLHTATITAAVIIVILLGYGTYVRNMTWRDAVTLWSDVVKKNPLSHRGYNNLGMELSDKGRFKEAIENLRLSLKIKPDSAKTYNNLGNTFMRQGLTEKAINEYLHALKINRAYVKTYNNLGLALASQGKFEEAIHYYSKAISLKYNYEDAHNNLAIALAEKGKLDEAIRQFLEAIKIHPSYENAHYNLSLVLLRKGKLQEAEDHLYRALKINPDDAKAHYYMGKTLEKRGRFNESITHYYEALKIKPDFAKVHMKLGISLSRLGKFNEAIEHYEEALDLEPKNEDAHMNLGVILGRQGKLQEAINHYTEVLKINPDNENVHYNLAGLMYKQGDLTKAIDHYKKAIDIRPDFPQAHNNLGLILVNQGKLKEAISHYNEALRIRPDNIETHINIGVAFVNYGKTKEAASHFIHVLRIKPDHPEAHFYLGTIYVIIKRKDLAMDEYKVLEKLHPDLAKILLQRINQGIKAKPQ
jgi:protein O-mannosyl-transferase